MREYSKIGDEKIQKMILHPLDAGGKRIRPCLTLLAAEAVGGDPESILPAAASVELLHTFTLVHDDIMDHDEERRGKPTVHSIWGDEMGIMIGDTLYSSSFKALIDMRNKGVEDSRVLKAVEALVEANTELQEGQIMDMLFEKDDQVTEDQYMTMIGKKTGALIEAAVKIGCIVGGGSEEQLEAFRIYGSNCGVAFQIKDDVLDLTADAKKLGKPVGSDIRSGKKTLIIVHALAKACEEDRDMIKAVLGNDSASDEDVKAAIDKLGETGSIEYADERVAELISEGKRALGILPDCEAKDSLIEIADFLIDRNM
ncbi:MAG: polyprenyl synthetase family protein [Candidatus Altiarchaeales archaeon]|nr:polyprenyl synthetase family protein [Candidatus Altiarchaeales archaeon]MBD3416156.1 polyprenyl synthetase family protein [Candidatus Altiarchaeales archaeon]